ncbi:hypothetical protein [Trichocoleus sp. FACHB-262]|uniref:hypothetical protein n=1 Tax=Trichocoleus sp. FACHB-262 TaxID=2692869 RepID=UPI001684849C|nr:hypothetical protein [Trichocoleus sp. FACHB-262]MBD2120941.1 hypothetical protein [Trichocoleus sp. FACHB-262]
MYWYTAHASSLVVLKATVWSLLDEATTWDSFKPLLLSCLRHPEIAQEAIAAIL